MDHRFSSTNQPTNRRGKGDPLTSCLKAFLLDERKAAAKGKLSAKLAKYPPRVMQLVQSLYGAAIDPDSRSFGKAQDLIWNRIAGKVAQDINHAFPTVNESLEINTTPVHSPPMPTGDPSTN